MSAQAWPGVGGRVQVLQPAAGRAGKFTCARHVQPGVTPALGAGGGLAARHGGAAGPGTLQALEKGLGAGKSVFMVLAVTGVCARPGIGALGPTLPPPGFTSQPARQALPARPGRSEAPWNASTALPELELGAGSPPTPVQSPPHHPGLADRNRAVVAGLGPQWHGSIPALLLCRKQHHLIILLLVCLAA